jgi:prephenate dehydratase
MRRVAIQGVVGSFHDIALHRFFEGEDLEMVCCDTFEDVFAEMEKDSNVIGMVAIENTIAGSLLA